MNTFTKSLLSTVAAGFLVAGPASFTVASAQVGLGVQLGQQPHRDSDHDDRCNNYRGQRSGDDRGQRSGRDEDCDDWQDSRGDRRDERKEWRDDRRDARWDDAQHNGYFSSNGWHFGPPPAGSNRGRNFTLGYHPWKTGDKLGYYNHRYAEVGYRSQNLDRPKRGFHWVRDDRGVFLLVSISSGRITTVVNRNRH